MNRPSFKSLTRAGISMSTIAISIASVMALSACGSTGGSLSKAGDSGVAGGGSHGAASSGTTGAGTASSSTPTNTGTNTGTTGGAPVNSAKQASTSAWDGVVGGAGNVVMQVGDTVTALGTTLKLPSGSPVADNPVSAILTSTGGAIYGVGGGLTSGLEGIASNGNPVDVLVPSLARASAQTGVDVSDIGSSIGASGTGMPYATILSPSLTALGSSVSTVGGNFSASQFEAGEMLTDGTVQQLTSAVRPALYPVITGAIEVLSAVGDRTGLGKPLDTLVVQTGGLVATIGGQVSAASSSPVLQGLGGTVTATGETVAAVGAVINDGQPTSIVPITATGSAGTGILQGGMGSASLLPGGSTLLTTLSSSKVPALTSVLSGAASAGAPLANAVSQGVAAVSATTSVVAAPIVGISSTLSGSVSGSIPAPQSVSAVPLLTPVVAPLAPLVSGAIAALKGDTVTPSLATVVAHPGH